MVRGGGADLRSRLSFGKGDLILGPLHARGGVDGQLLGLGARLGDDGGGVRFRFGRLLLEAGEQRGRLLTQLRRLGQLGRDRFAARVERLQNDAMGAEIKQHAREDKEPEKDEKLRVDFHHAAPLSDLTELTAAATAAGCAGPPGRRSTIAPAVSRATSATLAIASARVAEISRSAAASLPASSSSRTFRLACASAAAASRAAWARVCAFARASANVRSCAAAAASACCCIAVASSRARAICALRPSITFPRAGNPRFDMYQYRNPKAIANQTICDGKVLGSNGGKFE